ncbi:MAG: hypothetical protein QOH43_4571 [Solirubrobacteraceae bacterium]|nr:hypothetical protein [Solirubrobacteraceae bacterium]
MGHRTGVAVLAAIMVLAVAPVASAAPACPDRLDPSSLPSAAGLRALNAKEWSYGPRPTGSPAHQRMVAWLERELRRVPGLRVSSLPYRIDAWAPRSAGLTVSAAGRTLTLPVAAPVPYSKATAAGGVTAPLVHVPGDQPITAANAAGRIVVRDAPPGRVPLGAFLPGALGYALYDPGHTVDPAATFEGDFLNYNARVHDLRDAATAGAAGVVFLKDRPRAQLRGHFEPYEGRSWGVPGVFLGADEATQLTAALEADPGARASLTLRAARPRVTTRTLLATLPGRSDRRLVIESHTDGTNAVEDNGPVAILAMARALARLPVTCRPRTIEFAFPTAHFYQRVASPDLRHGGAGVLARALDREYDRGKVAGVIVLEHLGAREYKPVARPGRPGRELRLSGRSELSQVFVTPSAPLRAAVQRQVERHRLDRTAMMVGADGTDPARAAEHCSFGGEGTPYAEQLLPTVALISAPASLYDPAFGLDSIDFARMRAQTLAFGDLALELSRMPAGTIAGDVTAERSRRLAGATACPADL